jgi:hypothetical protein
MTLPMKWKFKIIAHRIKKGIYGAELHGRTRGILPFAIFTRGYHPLDLGLRFDPVAMPLDQTAEDRPKVLALCHS